MSDLTSGVHRVASVHTVNSYTFQIENAEEAQEKMLLLYLVSNFKKMLIKFFVLFLSGWNLVTVDRMGCVFSNLWY